MKDILHLKSKLLGAQLKREGMYVHLELIHAVVQQKPTQHCKTITLQLKFLKELKIKESCYNPLHINCLNPTQSM